VRKSGKRLILEPDREWHSRLVALWDEAIKSGLLAQIDEREHLGKATRSRVRHMFDDDGADEGTSYEALATMRHQVIAMLGDRAERELPEPFAPVRDAEEAEWIRAGRALRAADAARFQKSVAAVSALAATLSSADDAKRRAEQLDGDLAKIFDDRSTDQSRRPPQ